MTSPLDHSNQALQGQSFRDTDLDGADFTGADLRSADFTNASLVKADFTNAQFGIRPFVGGVILALAMAVSALAGSLLHISCRKCVNAWPHWTGTTVEGTVWGRVRFLIVWIRRPGSALVR
jgi:hypothetical protein